MQKSLVRIGRSIAAAVIAAFVLVGCGGTPSAPTPSSTASSAASNGDPAGVVEAFVGAWNRHDGVGLGAVFAPEGYFVGISGTMWPSPAAIAQAHTQQFQGRYSESRFAVDGKPIVTLLNGDVALVMWRWKIAGVRDEKGAPMEPYAGIFTWTLAHGDGGWRIRQAQNNVTK